MSGGLNKSERETQNRVVTLFVEQLGYRYLGNLQYKTDNRNIEVAQLSQYLSERGYAQNQINKALDQLHVAANNHNQNLYANNQAVYQLLRYGVKVKTEAGKPTESVDLIDWQQPSNNHFYIAEEVTIHGNQTKRPDMVLYVNGIAVAVLELKNSRVSLSEGIRQSLVNQQPEWIGAFFSTVQFVFAGNDSQGLKYGTIGTPEKLFLTWKEDEHDNTGYKLDKYLCKMCDKARLLELMHDFIVFDAGVKKLPRVHQYFGIKAAQAHVRRREGGIIWHTQGSGKSIVMVLLAKWILENNAQARVVIVTDRNELDKQIEGVFRASGETIARSRSGRDLMAQLGQATPRLLCSLVHKFGKKDVANLEQWLKDMENQASHAVGELFVFVDECHRTQSGRLHAMMKAVMPAAVFIGFTGTPLLKEDKPTSLEVFGATPIHTYKFDEAVNDGVVLDLMYEARDIDQRLSSPAKVDAWFAAKTKGLNEFQRAALKKKWGTMQHVLSSKSRMAKVVADVLFDFSVKARLSSEKGNAILITASIYEACRYFELFQASELKGKCAVITSYNPQYKDINTEDTGENTQTEKEYIYQTYTNVLQTVTAATNKSKAETYADQAKALFVTAPSQMKLLIVVNQLLTGFDAPPCSYLYIDKQMQDHGLFQAICRVNRLDSDDKLAGYIVDYKDLFKHVESAIQVYTSELETVEGGSGILLKDRLKAGRERLDDALEALALLCEKVEPPKNDLAYIHYFCGNSELPSDLKARELQRTALYLSTVALIRAYANLADELEAAGYNHKEISHIKAQVQHYVTLRETIRQASGENIDLKAYEADMRHLLDRYIQADESVVISPFAGMTLLDVIVNSGIAKAMDALPKGIKGNSEAVAESIENNVRSHIIKNHLLDPAYFEKMSKLLHEVIQFRKAHAQQYQAYLLQIEALAKQVWSGNAQAVPVSLKTKAQQALYHNVGEDEALALQLDAAIVCCKPAGWRGNQAKENIIKQAIWQIVQDEHEVERLFAIVQQQADY